MQLMNQPASHHPSQERMWVQAILADALSRNGRLATAYKFRMVLPFPLASEEKTGHDQEILIYSSWLLRDSGPTDEDGKASCFGRFLQRQQQLADRTDGHRV